MYPFDCLYGLLVGGLERWLVNVDLDYSYNKLIEGPLLHVYFTVTVAGDSDRKEAVYCLFTTVLLMGLRLCLLMTWWW